MLYATVGTCGSETSIRTVKHQDYNKIYWAGGPELTTTAVKKDKHCWYNTALKLLSTHAIRLRPPTIILTRAAVNP